jgi:hypothetical protein
MSGESGSDKRPKCPICGYPDAARLMPGESFNRWQCRNHDCLHQWTTPREGYRPAPSTPAGNYSGLKEEEVVAMANGGDKSDRTCPKCAKPFKFPSFMRAHVGGCQGEAAAAPAKAARAKRNGNGSPPPKAPASIVPAMGLIPIVTQIPEHLVGSDLAPAMQRLLDRKRQLDDERVQLDQALNAISRLQPAEAETRPT